MKPVKLFLTIFAAILAAAAVIWGVISYDAAQKEREAIQASNVEGIATHTLIGRQAMDSLRLNETLEEFYFGHLKNNISMIEGMWRFYPKRHRRMRELTGDFVFTYRETVKAVREKLPDRKAWCDEMDGLLTKLEALVSEK